MHTENIYYMQCATHLLINSLLTIDLLCLCLYLDYTPHSVGDITESSLCSRVATLERFLNVTCTALDLFPNIASFNSNMYPFNRAIEPGMYVIAFLSRD